MNTARITRRGFLKTTGALAVPAVVPASVFGAPDKGKKAPSDKILMGQLACGGRGSAVMGGFARYKDVQYLAVCDPFKSRRDRAAGRLNKKYGGGDTVKACADFREVLARDDIEAVAICSQDHWHVPLAIAAARAGKDMYVEKPLGVSMRWAWELRKAIKRYKNVFQYGTQQRSGRNFRFACELAVNGYLGEIKRIDAWCPDIDSQVPNLAKRSGAKGKGPEYGVMKPMPVPGDLNYDLWIGPAPMKPYTSDRCRNWGTYHIYDYALGFIAGWGAHPLDIAQWGMNADGTSPVSYEGTGSLPTRGLYDTIDSWDIHCKYANGVKMRFMGHRVARPVVMKYRKRWCGHGTTFHGKDGWVSVDRGGIYASDPKLLKVQIKPDGIRLIASPGQARNLLDCVRTRKATVNPVESAIRSDTISHMSDILIRTGRPIKWNPKTEQIIGDEQATRMLQRPLRPPWEL